MMKTFLRLCLLAILASCQSVSKKEVDVPSAGGGCVCRLSDEADGHRGAGRGGWE